LGIREIRKLGKDFCETEGSQHYKDGGVEPIDLIISKGLGIDFCIANIIKYAARFKNTGNLEDVKKAVDYGHILAGIELDKLQIARGKLEPDVIPVPATEFEAKSCSNCEHEYKDDRKEPCITCLTRGADDAEINDDASADAEGLRMWAPKPDKSCSNCYLNNSKTCSPAIEKICKANNLSSWGKILEF